MLPELRISHDFLSHALRREGYIVLRALTPAVTGDACRNKKLSATRQVKLLLLTIRNKINNQIKDFMSHPLQFGVIFSFTICLNCNFFAATVNVQYLNIRFSSYIALFGLNN